MTLAPAVGLELLDVTLYDAAAVTVATVMVTVAPVPSELVATTVPEVAAADVTVKFIVAIPELLVLLVAVENVPVNVPVVVQVTTLPA